MTLAKVKTISEILSAWFGLVALVLGGAFAIVQYHQKKSDDRIQVSLAFLDTYNSDTLYEARKTLRDGWAKHRLDLDVAAKNHSTSSYTEFSKLVNQVVVDEELLEHIVVLTDFFGRLSICNERNLCDPDTSLALFHRDAMLFFNLHYPFIEREREENDQGFAMNLQRLVLSK